ncbi:hypothetical protein ACU045_15215 [Microbacterium sp. MAHUQ-60]|uniref:hypothetical protein n=1 Tax=unclassified Microbacterium TaxID=2609290 RepID=UPI00360EED79
MSSPERKSVQTVALALGLPESAVATAASFREVDRVERVHDGFSDARGAWIAGRLDARNEGWEIPDAAVRRFHEWLLAHDAEHVRSTASAPRSSTPRLTSIDPTAADGPEFDDPSRGAYEVEFVTRDELRALDLRPSELKELLLAQR